MANMKLALLGATGSIGSQTLDVLRLHRDEIKLTAVTCGSDIQKLEAIRTEFQPEFAGLARYDGTEPAGIICGSDVNERAVIETDCDTVLDAIAGMDGLSAVMTALNAGKRVLLANKEALVAGGGLVMAAARELDARMGLKQRAHMPPHSLTPIDSEHTAILQCIAGHPEKVRRVIITASGGPFRTWDKADIYNATAQQALKHPNWNMGGKVTIDSATLFNKGLEVTEACHLYDIPLSQVQVLVHPQSIIHSMVEFSDGSIIAQLASLDMRGPIACALGWPDRIESGIAPLDLTGRSLTFDEPDLERFPCLALAFRAIEEGGGMSCVANAADEAAVAAFLRGEIKCGDIARIIEATIDKFAGSPAESVEQLVQLGAQAHEYANSLIRQC